MLILPGGSPSGEIDCIRSLWSDAHITASDVVAASVEAAKNAGADVSRVCDIYRVSRSLVENDRYIVPKFDVIHLDFCGLVDKDKKQCLLSLSQRALSPSGIIMMTFGYGHDVVERFVSLARGGNFGAKLSAPTQKMVDLGMPESVIGRLKYLTSASLRMMNVFLYQGKNMPMCIVLWQKKNSRGKWPQNLHNTEPLSFARVSEELLEEAVVGHAQISKLYAMPDERVREIMRRAAARKAVATRTRRAVVAVTPVAETKPAIPESMDAISLRMRVEATEREIAKLVKENHRLTKLLEPRVVPTPPAPPKIVSTPPRPLPSPPPRRLASIPQPRVQQASCKDLLQAFLDETGCLEIPDTDEDLLVVSAHKKVESYECWQDCRLYYPPEHLRSAWDDSTSGLQSTLYGIIVAASLRNPASTASAWLYAYVRALGRSSRLGDAEIAGAAYKHLWHLWKEESEGYYADYAAESWCKKNGVECTRVELPVRGDAYAELERVAPQEYHHAVTRVLPWDVDHEWLDAPGYGDLDFARFCARERQRARETLIKARGHLWVSRWRYECLLREKGYVPHDPHVPRFAEVSGDLFVVEDDEDAM